MYVLNWRLKEGSWPSLNGSGGRDEHGKSNPAPFAFLTQDLSDRGYAATATRARATCLRDGFLGLRALPHCCSDGSISHSLAMTNDHSGSP